MINNALILLPVHVTTNPELKNVIKKKNKRISNYYIVKYEDNKLESIEFTYLIHLFALFTSFRSKTIYSFSFSFFRTFTVAFL